MISAREEQFQHYLSTLEVVRISAPYAAEQELISAHFKHPALDNYVVTVLADSCNNIDDIANAERKSAGEATDASCWNSHGISSDTNGKIYQDAPNCGRLTTVLARFPRCVLSEINTHRVFSRNSASSRARSVRTTIREVMTNPYIPLFTNNARGMSGDFVSAEVQQKASKQWVQAAHNAVGSVLNLLLGEENLREFKNLAEAAEDYNVLLDRYYEDIYIKESNAVAKDAPINIHKQDVNRLLEPFMWHETIITSSYWENFLKLRKDVCYAHPSIALLAHLLEAALLASAPRERIAHLPFLRKEEQKEFLDIAAKKNGEEILNYLLLSASNCAQVSYKDKSSDADSASLKLGRRLLTDGHMSPFEHVALANNEIGKELCACFSDLDDLGDLERTPLHGNLDPAWIQLRQVLTK